MTRTLILSTAALCVIAFLNLSAAEQNPANNLPKFMTEKDFTCAMFAEAINHYVDMGEAKAIAALKSYADAKPRVEAEDQTHRRMAFICRVLFEPKEKAPLRPPAFGGLTDLPNNSMPLEKWPLYPIVHAGDSYFVLAEGYSLDGKAERTIAYIEYCCVEGKFRKNRVPVPNRAQALRDYELLRKSEPWKALKWIDKGQGFEYHLSEELVLSHLEAQATAILKK